jgi:hypothetical protein
MGRLLFNIEQAAAFAEVDRSEIMRASRDGKLPRWSLPGRQEIFFDAADVERVFSGSVEQKRGASSK